MNVIEISSGIESEPKTVVSLQAFKSSQSENSSVLTIFFPCSSQLFAKSLQVLLQPYFTNFTPIQTIKENVLQIAIEYPKLPLFESFKFDLKIGVNIEQVHENFFQEIFESMQLRIESENINEIFGILGLGTLKIGRTNMNLYLDCDDIPKEMIEYFVGELKEYFKVTEVMAAIRPFLKESRIQLKYESQEIRIEGFINY